MTFHIVMSTTIIFLALIHLPSALLIIWFILRKFVRRKKIYFIYHQTLLFFCLNSPSHSIIFHFGDFLKVYAARKKMTRNVNNLFNFFGLNTILSPLFIILLIFLNLCGELKFAKIDLEYRQSPKSIIF